MGKPESHIPVKLVVGLISGQTPQFTLVKRILEKKYGQIDTESGTLDFSCTHYYEKELGCSLKRKFLSFKRPIALEKSYRIKLFTNRLEAKLSQNGLRSINIDPGYVTLSKLVLFTTKNGSHRIYVGRGIYADLEFQFQKKSFHPLEWTYPDYKSSDYIEFFNSARAAHASEVKKCFSK